MMFIIILIGLLMFTWGFKEIIKKSILENIIDVILDSFSGIFIFSEIGAMLFGLLLMVLGLVELLT